MNREDLTSTLQGVCDWYNDANQDRLHDPVLPAAQLQRRVISLHPFTFGVNGRPTRALMNWSLENEGLPPSTPADFDDDVLSTLSEWRSRVEAGMERYERIGKLVVAGEAEVVALLGLRVSPRFVCEYIISQKTPYKLLAH